MSTNDDRKFYFDMFVLIMRLSYMRKAKEMKQWSEAMASKGKEKQKNFWSTHSTCSARVS